MLISHRAPGHVPDGAYQYVAERAAQDKEEPPELKGVVFRQDPDGSHQILRYSGETTPDGSDLPADVIVDNEVLIYVDGIGQRLREHQRQIRAVIHGADLPGGLNRPVIGVHEGAGPSTLADVARIGRNITFTKALQWGIFNKDWVKKAAFNNDPAVQSVYNLVRQSLAAGVQVTLMTHSGGGAETALALTLLSREENFKEAIQDSVRVLSTASAASQKDFLDAGVRSENLYYTGSTRDAVYRGFRHHIHQSKWWTSLPTALDAGVAALKAQGAMGLFHSVDYIFHNHETTEGNRLENFLRGGPGQKHELEFEDVLVDESKLP